MGPAIDLDRGYLVLGIGPRLHNHGPMIHRIHVHQRDRGRFVRQPLHERRYVRGYPGAPPRGVEVPQAAVQRFAVPGVQSTQHQLGQTAVDGRIELQRIVRHPGIGGTCIRAHAVHLFADGREFPAQRRLGKSPVSAVQKRQPRVLRHVFKVRPIHRPVVDVQRALVVGRLLVVVPAVVAVHMRVHRSAVHRAGIRVHGREHPAPDVHVFLLSRQQQRISETRHAPDNRIPVGQFTRLRHDYREPPAVTPAIPLAVAFASDCPVQSDVAGEDAVVRGGPFRPCIHVIDDPVPVFFLRIDHKSVEAEGRGRQIDGMVADHVRVFLEVRQHFLEIALAVRRVEPPLHLDGVSRPVQRGRFP